MKKCLRARWQSWSKFLGKKAFILLVVLTASLCILVPATIAKITNNQINLSPAYSRPINLPKPLYLQQRNFASIERLEANTIYVNNNISNNVASETLEQQAQSLYKSGRFSEAITLLEQALQNYHQSGDRIGEAIVLSNLTLSYQQLGNWDKATNSLNKALAILRHKQNTPEWMNVWAQVLDVQGNFLLTRGDAQQALASWQQAAKLYQKIGNSSRNTATQINQAQALQVLGLYRQAIATLEDLAANLQNQPPSLTKAVTLRSLGDALRVAGDLTKAEAVLQDSLKIAQQLQLPEVIAATNLSLGNVMRSRGTTENTQEKLKNAQTSINSAWQFYQAAVNSPDVLTRAQAYLNQLSLLTETPQRLLPNINPPTDAAPLYQQVQQLIPSLPPGRQAIAVQIGLGQQLMWLKQENPESAPEWKAIAQTFAIAAQQAKTLNDQRAISEALGNLGSVYEKLKQWSDAQTLTEQALVLAQSIQAPDLAYQWQWQLGRVLCRDVSTCNAYGNIEAAISAYNEAFKSLQSLRRDLVATNADVQFSFRESVEPIYRQLVDLLLQPQGTNAPSQQNLKQTREVLEALQVAELENFLQAACQDTHLQLDRVIDQKDRTTAVIYPIILSDRLEVILKLPGKSDLFRYPPSKLSKEEINATINQLWLDLQEEYTFEEVKAGGQKVYDWLIRPARESLEKSGIRNLIFVLDASLKSIPMSILHDGEHYLVEKYATSLALGLEVRAPQPLHRQNLKVLAASLTEPPKRYEKTYSRLDNVNAELDQIQKQGLSVKFIRDRAFTQTNFVKNISADSFQVVHFATHGQFGASRDSTYLLSADGVIDIDQLSTLFRNRQQKKSDVIELLVLSACKTATGNDRAVLGLAGTTVRAGAQSAIGGLWNIADVSSVQFMQELYKHLGKPGINRAEALRLAQVALLKNSRYDHPRFWAPYVLIGNWL